MIPKITNILYATDLSANSAYAFCYAVNLAEMHNARIAILHVIHNFTDATQALLSSHFNEIQQDKILKDKITYTSDWVRERFKKHNN